MTSPASHTTPCYIRYDHRDTPDGGPADVGPFPSEAAAYAWHERQPNSASQITVEPLHRPEPVSGPDVAGLRDAAEPYTLYSAPEQLLLAAEMASLVVQGFSLSKLPDAIDGKAEAEGQLMLVLEFKGRRNKSPLVESYSIAIPADQIPHLMGMLLRSCAAAGIDEDVFLDVLTRELGHGA